MDTALPVWWPCGQAACLRKTAEPIVYLRETAFSPAATFSPIHWGHFED